MPWQNRKTNQSRPTALRPYFADDILWFLSFNNATYEPNLFPIIHLPTLNELSLRIDVEWGPLQFKLAFWYRSYQCGLTATANRLLQVWSVVTTHKTLEMENKYLNPSCTENVYKKMPSDYFLSLTVWYGQNYCGPAQ